MTTNARPLLAAAGIIPLALLLTGCFGIPGLGGDREGVVEEILEGSTGQGVDVEFDDLPQDFPVDDVPLVDGDVVAGFTVPGSDGKKAWQVTIAVADEAAAREAQSLLEAAGFSDDTSMFWENEEYIVVVSGAASDGAWHVSYIVSQQ